MKKIALLALMLGLALGISSVSETLAAGKTSPKFYEITGKPRKALEAWGFDFGMAVSFVQKCPALKIDRMAVKSALWRIQNKYKLKESQWAHLNATIQKEKGPVEKRVIARLKKQRLYGSSSENYCRVGKRHLAKRTAIGRMLKAR